MKSLKTIRSSVKKYREPEAYAQYLFRTNQAANDETWIRFMSNYNNRRKISRPLRVIKGGVA